MQNVLDVLFSTYTDETPMLSLYLSGRQIKNMNTWSGPHLQDTYNIILLTKFHISRRSSDIDLVQKILVGTL